MDVILRYQSILDIIQNHAPYHKQSPRLPTAGSQMSRRQSAPASAAGRIPIRAVAHAINVAPSKADAQKHARCEQTRQLSRIEGKKTMSRKR
ncbi:uncharacterized protein BKA55DRAFT_576541 [Fusarium redolens]|uniref:Uncharacterized protein n=1 Tax=Fusarium redolens TaxID=48865 RepID=A0A9P9GM31_FUSRE|nr:uncharacterized protein BKA55DRAFT_576541 [Fusarium redolens]KAH7241118.1 hypothetical protein BKA55DRAFT_576541 [Fusarium redolens]